MITSATQGSTNQRVVDPSKYSEFVESIAAYLVKARDTYGVTVDSISINESDGGYRLKFTSAEMISLIKIAGPRFESLGLNPTWLVGDTTTPSALVNYATPILQDATARQYIGAISYHSWGAFQLRRLRLPRHRESRRAVQPAGLVRRGRL
jgi:O-glycosyl hydrolase